MELPQVMVIPRKRGSVDLTGIDAELAEDAKRVLGYSLMNDRVDGNELYLALDRLGIEPFDQQEVNLYKTRMEKLNSNRTPSAFSMGMWAHWVRVPIAEYTKEIPQFVLQTAVRIKDELPGATIMVDELRRESFALRDPFLVACYGDVAAYVEVWDEPSFNGKRIVELPLKQL